VKGEGVVATSFYPLGLPTDSGHVGASAGWGGQHSPSAQAVQKERQTHWQNSEVVFTAGGPRQFFLVTRGHVVLVLRLQGFCGRERDTRRTPHPGVSMLPGLWSGTPGSPCLRTLWGCQHASSECRHRAGRRAHMKALL